MGALGNKVIFGGVNRAQVSSQCWKRAIRQIAAANAPDAFGGIRGHYHAESLEKELIALSVDTEMAKNAAEEVLATLAGKKTNDPGVMLYFSQESIKAMAKIIQTLLNEKKTW